jgi:hypothetical protein
LLIGTSVATLQLIGISRVFSLRAPFTALLLALAARRVLRASIVAARALWLVFFLCGHARVIRRAQGLTRARWRVSVSVLRIAALRVAGTHLIGGRRRILVRRSGTFGYIRHGGAL